MSELGFPPVGPNDDVSARWYVLDFREPTIFPDRIFQTSPYTMNDPSSAGKSSQSATAKYIMEFSLDFSSNSNNIRYLVVSATNQ